MGLGLGMGMRLRPVLLASIAMKWRSPFRGWQIAVWVRYPVVYKVSGFMLGVMNCLPPLFLTCLPTSFSCLPFPPPLFRLPPSLFSSQGERCSFSVQMWHYHLQGLKHDLWTICPGPLATSILASLLARTVSHFASRYTAVRPSYRRVAQYR